MTLVDVRLSALGDDEPLSSESPPNTSSTNEGNEAASTALPLRRNVRFIARQTSVVDSAPTQASVRPVRRVLHQQISTPADSAALDAAFRMSAEYGAKTWRSTTSYPLQHISSDVLHCNITLPPNTIQVCLFVDSITDVLNS